MSNSVEFTVSDVDDLEYVLDQDALERSDVECTIKFDCVIGYYNDHINKTFKNACNLKLINDNKFNSKHFSYFPSLTFVDCEEIVVESLSFRLLSFHDCDYISVNNCVIEEDLSFYDSKQINIDASRLFELTVDKSDSIIVKNILVDTRYGKGGSGRDKETTGIYVESSNKFVIINSYIRNQLDGMDISRGSDVRAYGVCINDCVESVVIEESDACFMSSTFWGSKCICVGDESNLILDSINYSGSELFGEYSSYENITIFNTPKHALDNI